MAAWIRNFYRLRLPMWPRRTCRQVTALVLRNEDEALPWHERVAVRLHMQICLACPRFRRQVAFMRQAMGQWRKYSESEG